MDNKIKCNKCGSMVSDDYKIDNSTYICPYCGNKIPINTGVDNGNNGNPNTNVNKRAQTNAVNRNVQNNNQNDEQKSKADYIRKKSKAENKKTIIIVIAALICIGILGNMYNCAKGCIMGGQEKYKVGSSRDYINKNYKEVVAKFESMGFTNIELVDLDDAGVLTGEVDTVKSISIGGDDSFTDFDYFSKDEKVTIIYH